MRLDRHDHPIGEIHRFGGILQEAHSPGFGIAAQFLPVTGTGPHIPGCDRPRTNQAVGQRLRHIAEADKSYLHSVTIFPAKSGAEASCLLPHADSHHLPE